MQISDILRHKGSVVVTVSPGDSVTAALAQLTTHKIGALVVTDDAGKVVGIVSERDVVRKLHEMSSAVLAATVDDIMTKAVLICSAQDSVDSVAATMTERRVRHMPVVDDGMLAGLVSIGDVVLSRMSQLEQDRSQLERYITG